MTQLSTPRFLISAAALLVLGSCSDNANVTLTGYVEGDFALIGASDGGRITAIAVNEGDRVASGDLLFTLDDTRERALLAEADARLANLTKGARAEELAVIDARIARAAAALSLADTELRRQRDLAHTDAGARARLQQAEAGFAQAEAQLNEARAERLVSTLGAREDDINAARAARTTAEWRLAERTVRAAQASIVEDVIFQDGEVALPGQPVVTLLPDGALKLRLFVAEPALTRVHPAMLLSVICDGCAPGLTARVTYISPRAEYTPPVIYSDRERAKLVFLVEATPTDASGLRPGLPVTAEPAATQ